MNKEKYLNVTLKKDSEIKKLFFKFKKLRQQAHAVKELSKYLRRGWQLEGLSGNSEYVDTMKKLIGNYKTGDPLPVRKMMAATGLHVLPGFLKKKLEKEEGLDEQETETEGKEEGA